MPLRHVRQSRSCRKSFRLLTRYFSPPNGRWPSVVEFLIDGRHLFCLHGKRPFDDLLPYPSGRVWITKSITALLALDLLFLTRLPRALGEPHDLQPGDVSSPNHLKSNPFFSLCRRLRQASANALVWRAPFGCERRCIAQVLVSQSGNRLAKIKNFF